MTDAAPDPRLPPIQPYHPTTFLERGVAVPFTTPALAGTRARPGQRHEVELILPNPSGARGVYVLPWRGICDLFGPTLHDRQLNEQLLALPAITPTVIRRVAQRIAAAGLAGDEAKEAALATEEADRNDQLLVNFLLLEILVEQVEARLGLERPAGRQSKADLEQRAQRAIAWIAPTIGLPANAISTTLETIAATLTHIGVERQSVLARIPRVLAILHRTCLEVAHWGAQQLNEQVRELSGMFCDVANVTVSLARTTLREVLALTSNIFDLLQRWLADPRKVADLAARPEWLLDGWEAICLIWDLAGQDASRIAALAEMAHLVPVLPREVADWVGYDVQQREPPPRFRHLVPLNEDWRTGVKVFELISRNEHLRAMDIKLGLRAA